MQPKQYENSMNKEEKDTLITSNMGYVVTLARQYKSDILSTDDLIGEGCIGLMKAAEKFDPSRGSHLSRLPLHISAKP